MLMMTLSMNKLTSLVFLLTTSVSSAAYLETMSFQKMDFASKYEFQNYSTLNASKINLKLKALPPKENYSLNPRLKLKTAGQFYFWQDLFKNTNTEKFSSSKNYSLNDFLPVELKKDILKVKPHSNHKELGLFWIEWQKNQNLNNQLWTKEFEITDTDYQNIISEQTKPIANNKIKFGDLMFFEGTSDIDNTATVFATAIYLGNGIVLEKADLPNGKSLLKYSFLKDLQARWSKKVLDVKISFKRIKTGNDFNLVTTLHELKKQDKGLEANSNSDMDNVL